MSLTAYYWNYSDQKYNYDLGWGLYDSNGNLVSTHTVSSNKSLNAHTYTNPSGSINVGKNITSGTYYLKPVCRLSGSSTYYPCRGAGINYIKATITSTKLTLKVYDEQEVMKLRVNSVTASSIKKVGSPLLLTLNVTNQGLADYNSIYMWVGSKKVSGTYTDIGIGETGNVVMSYTPSETGTISFKFTSDSDGEKTLKTLNVTINSATAATITGTTTSSVVGTTFNATVTATNTNTNTYNDYIVAKLYKKEPNSGNTGYYSSSQSQILNLASNSTKNVDFAFTSLDYNETYFVIFYYINNGEQVRIGSTASRTVYSPYTVTGISLNETSHTLNFNGIDVFSFTLAATVTPADADNLVLAWSSSDENVAVVDNNGTVTSAGRGTATITASSTDGSNISASCEVTVMQLATSVTLNEQEVTLFAGDDYTLTAAVLPENADNKTVVWSSSDPEVASVDEEGNVTALTVGTSTITASTTDGSDLAASCQVTVLPASIPGDANEDGKVTIGDYVTVAMYILEQDPQPFNFAAADIDKNNEITVGDLVGVAYIALHFEGAPQLAPAVEFDEPSIVISADVAGSGGSYDVSVNLSNNVGISAMQMDLNLPQGMKLVDAVLSDRASPSHQVAFSQLANGDYRLLASSNVCKAFSDNNGAVLTLTFAGTPTGSGNLSNIMLATPSAASYSIDDIALSFITTGIDNVRHTACVYSDGGNIVIVSPSDSMAQIVLLNGMSRTVQVKTGRNIYPAPAKGVVIVKTGSDISKIRF